MGQSQEREIAPACKSSQARSRQDERPSSAWSIEGADYWQLEGCREIGSDRQRPGCGPRKELWQHQCLVPLHGKGCKGKQESRAGPVCLCILRASIAALYDCDAENRNQSRWSDGRSMIVVVRLQCGSPLVMRQNQGEYEITDRRTLDARA